MSRAGRRGLTVAGAGVWVVAGGIARTAVSDCCNASITNIRCATLATMWCCSARGGMRTTVGAVGKWDVEQLGVVGGLLHTGADGVLGWWAFEFDHRSVLPRGWLVRDRNVAAAVGAENALLGGAEGAAAVAGEGGVGGAGSGSARTQSGRSSLGVCGATSGAMAGNRGRRSSGS